MRNESGGRRKREGEHGEQKENVRSSKKTKKVGR